MAADELKAARARLASAQAAREKRLLALARGDLVEVAAYAREMNAANNVARSRLLAAPAKLALHVFGAPAAEARELIRDELNEIFDQLPASITPRPGAAPAAERGSDDDGDDDAQGRSRLARSSRCRRGSTSASGPGIPEASARGARPTEQGCSSANRGSGKRDGRRR